MSLYTFPYTFINLIYNLLLAISNQSIIHINYTWESCFIIVISVYGLEFGLKYVCFLQVIENVVDTWIEE